MLKNLVRKRYCLMLYHFNPSLKHFKFAARQRLDMLFKLAV